MYNGADRRVFERFGAEVTVRYASERDSRIHYAVTENVSGGGMRVSLLEKLMPGTKLNLQIFKNNSKVSARCKGEVMWVKHSPPTEKKPRNSFEAGVRFVGLNLMYIGTLIDNLKTQNAAADLASVATY